MHIKKIKIRGDLAIACFFVLAGCATTSPKETFRYAENLTRVDQYTLAGKKHFLHDYAAMDVSGNINVVVEIPSGTTEKWEVEKKAGHLKWGDFKNGKPRVVKYLGYPGNYGMIPRTLLPKELGGDGDPLDVLIIGAAVPRGSLVAVRPIGVLTLLDNGEQDDKIIAILRDSPLEKVATIEELQRDFKGITDIIEIWFSNYKGAGELESKGFKGVKEANNIIKAAIAAYEKNQSTTK